jgi:hypothetical protein
LLGWIAAVAVILAMARWIAPEEIGGGEAFSDPEALILVPFVLVPALLALPAVLPCVAVVLGDQGRRRHAVWFAVTVAGMAVGLSMAVFLSCHLSEGPLAPSELADVARMSAITAISVETGFLITLIGGLGILRLCDYRLSTRATRVFCMQPGADPHTLYERQDAIGIRPAPNGHGQPRGRRSRFVYLTAALGLVAVAMYWPARAVDLARQQTASDRQMRQQFRLLGVDAVVRGGQVLDLNNGPTNQPIPLSVLKKLHELGEAVRIEYLDLSGSPLTDAQMPYLAGLKRLKFLNLEGAQVTDAGLIQLRSLTHLEQLGLCKTRVTNQGLEILRELPNLKSLRLDSTRISDAGMKHLGYLDKLEYLNLCDTQLTDDGLLSLRSLKGLAILYLDGTQITDAGLARLHGLRHLRAISAGSTQVTDGGKSALVRSVSSCAVLPQNPESVAPLKR